MATTEPQKWSATLGNTADVNAIPATTPSGSGRASFSGLFPPVTQLPLDQGGIAPVRGDFNALFKYLGEYIYYARGPILGFNGSGLHPFNQAPFVNGGPQDLDV